MTDSASFKYGLEWGISVLPILKDMSQGRIVRVFCSFRCVFEYSQDRMA